MSDTHTMQTKLKPKYEFKEQATKKIKKGMSLDETLEFAESFKEVTGEEAKALYDSLIILSPFKMSMSSDSEVMKMARAELEIRYHNLDTDFIDKHPNLVTIQRGENVSFYNYENGVYKELLNIDIEYMIDIFMVDRLMFAYRTKSRVSDCVSRISATLSRIKGKNFRDDFIFKQKYYLNLKNGLLNMETFELLPHTPEYFSVCQLPFDYDPKADCPEFKEFVATVSNGEEDTGNMIKEMYGYTIGSNRNAKHKVFYLYGETARNGKSTTAKILCGLVGDQNVSNLSLSQLSSEGTSVVSSIVNKQLNFSDEVSSKYIESSALTTMSAEGKISVREIYKSPFNYIVTCKFIVACNDLPRFRDSQGMFHRLISIPFNYQIPEGERIERYDEILLEKEGSGILNWAIEGVVMLRENGKFTINEQSRQDSIDNKMESNSVFAYLEDNFDFDPGYIEEFALDELYGSKKDRDHNGTGYNLYCFISGLKDVSRPNFAKELRRYSRESKKIEDKRKTNGVYYTGLREKPKKAGKYDDLISNPL